MMLGLMFFPFWYTKVKVSGWNLAVEIAENCCITSSGISILAKLRHVTTSLVFKHSNVYPLCLLLLGLKIIHNFVRDRIVFVGVF